MDTDTLIIGAGLAGLNLAAKLTGAGRNVMLLEARDRVGGRILSVPYREARFDLGPAWYWTGQPRMASMIKRFGLQSFEQFSHGDLVFQDQQGQVMRGRGYASMEGSLRISGGMAALTKALHDALPVGTVRLSSACTELKYSKGHVSATTVNGDRFTASSAVLALPPRLAAGLDLEPALLSEAISALQSAPTWMGGQAKVVATYDRPFWREDGLSGDAMSQRGPLVEIHDASHGDQGPYALFGFVGVPPKHRMDADALRASALQQLGQIFGPDALRPTKVIFKDWATDAWTSTREDLTPLRSHPRYGTPSVLNSIWDGRLHFAGSEFAQAFGGFLEGALEASDTVADALVASSEATI